MKMFFRTHNLETGRYCEVCMDISIATVHGQRVFNVTYIAVNSALD